VENEGCLLITSYEKELKMLITQWNNSYLYNNYIPIATTGVRLGRAGGTAGLKSSSLSNKAKTD
jgi:hypothetical protein